MIESAANLVLQEGLCATPPTCVACADAANADRVGAVSVVAAGHAVFACGGRAQSGCPVKQEPTKAITQRIAWRCRSPLPSGKERGQVSRIPEPFDLTGSSAMGKPPMPWTVKAAMTGSSLKNATNKHKRNKKYLRIKILPKERTYRLQTLMAIPTGYEK
ncbi:MAG: hypothetical protein ACRYGL_19560 [Janthinobacterium lividum]